jgi:cytoskeleton protein RodZ
VTEQIDSKPGEIDGAGASALSHPSAVSTVEQLVAARQAVGLGASDIASRLGMATRQIESLERGDWKSLPGQAFVRAALRSYGKTLGIDVEPLLASIGGQVSAPELKASASLESPMPRGGGFGFGSGGSSGRLAWIVLGVAAVIAIVFYFGPAFELGQRTADGEIALAPPPATPAGQGGNASPAGSQGAAAGGAPFAAGAAGSSGGAAAGAPSPAAAPGAAPSLAPLTPLAPLAPLAPAGSAASPADSAAAAAAAGGAPSPAAGAGSSASAPASSAASPAPASATAPAPAPAASEAPPPAVSADTETLRLRFGRESWVEIREAGGKVILTGLQPAGSERELSGRKPLTLVIGNAEHVTLERGGKPVDLAARARQGVARLTLD